jgi:hypothetical protein
VVKVDIISLGAGGGILSSSSCVRWQTTIRIGSLSGVGLAF